MSVKCTPCARARTKKVFCNLCSHQICKAKRHIYKLNFNTTTTENISMLNKERYIKSPTPRRDIIGTHQVSLHSDLSILLIYLLIDRKQHVPIAEQDHLSHSILLSPGSSSHLVLSSVCLVHMRNLRH